MLAPAARENIWDVGEGSKWGPAVSVPPPPSHKERQVVILQQEAVIQTDWAALREHKKALLLRYRKVQ